MGENGERLLQRLKELVEIPSPTGQEEAILLHLARVLEHEGFEIAWQELAPRRRNLYARRGEFPFLVATHVDTVPEWNHPDAYRLHVDGDIARGRGVVDTKGQIAAALEACASIRCAASFAFFVDEEDWALGSEQFDWPWEQELRGAVVLEPTGLSIATAQAGSFELEISVPGYAQHGATFREENNAILRAIELITEIRGLPFWQSSDPRFGKLGITVGRITGGIDVQIMPDRCDLQIDVPVLPEHGLDLVRDAVLSIVEKFGASYTVHHHDPPFVTAEDEAVVQELREAHERALGSPARFSGFTAWSDAENLVKKGLPCVIYGAGELATAHTAAEAVRVSDLLALRNVLREFFSGGSTPA